MKNIKHIFFDLDHTIWDFEKNSSEALYELFFEFELNNHSNSVDDFIATYQKINADYWVKYGAGLIDKETIRYGRFRDTLAILGISENEKFIYAISNKYVAITPHKTHVFPNTYETLSYLKEKYILHIISNGFSEIIAIKMEKSKLSNYFQLVLSSEEVGVHKPNPLVFETAMSRTGAHATESLMIGDNYKVDIIGARNSGMKTIFFNPKKEDIDGKSIEIHDLRELREIL